MSPTAAWTPRAAYARLLARFGPQGWWPTTPRGGKTPRYRPGRYGRPRPGEAVEVCLGALLTQNTAWTNVEKALGGLHGDHAASLESIGAMEPRRLRRLIRSSGYFRQKAARLKDFAEAVGRRGGPGPASRQLTRWLASPLPKLREDLLAVRGIGPETADSMLLYAGGRPSFVVDAYTRRIGERLGWLRRGWSYGRVQAFFESALPRSVALYQECHALLVRLAKEHCRTRARCEGCPLLGRCRHARAA